MCSVRDGVRTALRKNRGSSSNETDREALINYMKIFFNPQPSQVIIEHDWLIRCLSSRSPFDQCIVTATWVVMCSIPLEEAYILNSWVFGQHLWKRSSILCFMI